MNNVELYIDGVAVVLPESFEISIIEENTFLTKSGEYTFDIELSLHNPTNARLYKHINRVNSLASFTKRKAILIVDNQVLMNGIEMVLKVSDRSVHVQLLSGNAELNFTGSDKKINELDLGQLPTMTPAIALDSLNKFYPQSNFVCTPVSTNEEDINVWNMQITTISNIIPQPYLLYYVEKLFVALGFTISENQLLNDELWKRVYVVHSSTSTYYKDFIPNWTILELIKEFENLFNVAFVINSIRQDVKIIKRTDYFDDNVVSLNEVIDEYESTLNSNNSVDSLVYDFVEYDLTGNLGEKWQRISDDVLDVVVHTYYDTYSQMSTDLHTNNNNVSHFDKKEIFHVAESGIDYMMWHLPTGWGLEPLNRFRPAGDKTSKNKVTLKIRPADITDGFKETYNWYTGSPGVPTNFQMPYIVKQEDAALVEDQTLVEMIENGVNKPAINESAIIPISIFGGIRSCFQADGNLDLFYSQPHSQNDIYLTSLGYSYFQEKLITNSMYVGMLISSDPAIVAEAMALIENVDMKLTLRLDGPRGLRHRYYAGSLSGDFTKQYVFDFPAGRYNARGLYVIKNREFICEKIESKVTAKGFAPMVRGYFYARD